MSIDQLIDKIIVDGNLKNLGAYYERLDEVDHRKVEEAAVLYLHNFSKTLIELEKSTPKDIYNIIDSRRPTASRTDKEMKESELINVSTFVT